MLPQDFSGQWVLQDSINTGGSYAGSILEIVINSPDTLMLDISEDFSPGDTLIIHNLLVGEFAETSYSINSLELSVNMETVNYPHYLSDFTNWLKIGKPTIEMENKLEILLGNNSSVLLPQIVIEEDLSAPVISPDRENITIRLPSNAGIEWDTSIPIVQLSGNAAHLISPIPEYNKELVSFNIEGDLSEGNNNLLINGLYLLSPTSLVDSASISLSLNSGYTDCDSSDNVIRIGTLTFNSLDDQFFFMNSYDRELNNITITQDTLISLIDTLIVLAISDSLMAIWDSTSISTNIKVFTNGDTINPISQINVQFSNTCKKLYIESPLLDNTENIIVTNLSFAGLNTPLLNTSSDGSLMMMLDDYIYNFVLTDTYRKIIGGPSISSLGSSSFIVGEENEFAKIDTILLKEDETVSILTGFDSLKIIIPEETSYFKWDTTSTLNLGASVIPVDYQKANTVASFLLDIPDYMGVGDSIKLYGLGLESITHSDTGFHLGFQFVKEGTIPTILDTAKISSGTLSINLVKNIEYPLGTSIEYKLPDITIEENATNILGKKRAVLLNLSDGLKHIADWQMNNQLTNEEVDSIFVSEDTLKVYFDNQLTNNKITFSGLKLTTSKIYSNIIHADSLINSFSHKTGGINISTEKNLGGYSPVIVDTSVNIIKYFPPVILDKPHIYSQANSNIISFPTSPGLFHPDSLFEPAMFQIIRKPWLNEDYSLFTDSSNSTVNIINTNWNLNDTILVIEAPYINISFSEKDLIKLNSWFDGLHYYDYNFDHLLAVNKAHLPFGQNFDIDARSTDTSRINWLYYTPELITFSKRERVISNDELDNFSINFGDLYVDSIRAELFGGITDFTHDSSFILIDSVFSLSKYADLQDDLYTLRLTSNNTNERGMVPVIRQFIIDNSEPEIHGISPKTGRSKHGGGHEVSKRDRINLSYSDSPQIEQNIFGSSIQFTQKDTVLTTFFSFQDSLELLIKMEWSEDLNYHYTNYDTLYIDRTQSVASNWTMQLDSLIFSLVNDNSLITESEHLNVRIIFTLSDYTNNSISDTVEYMVLFNDSKIFGSEAFNYPNPFSVARGEDTNIRYVINKEGLDNGKFIIFDAGGDIVYYNKDINVAIGTHTHGLIWDGTDLRGNKLASGIYFGYLEIDNEKPVRIKIAIINR